MKQIDILTEQCERFRDLMHRTIPEFDTVIENEFRAGRLTPNDVNFLNYIPDTNEDPKKDVMSHALEFLALAGRKEDTGDEK